MLSAVALVAFSFTGMANTGGEEKLNNNLELIKTIEIEKTTEKRDCFTEGTDALDSHEAIYGEMENDDYTFWVNLIYAACRAGF